MREMEWKESLGSLQKQIHNEGLLIHKVTSLLGDARDLDDLTEKVMITAQHLLKAERSTCYTYNWQEKSLTSMYAASVPKFTVFIDGTKERCALVCACACDCGCGKACSLVGLFVCVDNLQK